MSEPLRGTMNGGQSTEPVALNDWDKTRIMLVHCLRVQDDIRSKLDCLTDTVEALKREVRLLRQGKRLKRK